MSASIWGPIYFRYNWPTSTPKQVKAKSTQVNVSKYKALG